MDAEQKLKSYIMPRNGGRIIGLILTVVMVISAVGAAILSFTGGAPTAPFNANKVEGSDWCSLEIVGISEWVYRNGDEWYHIAEDSDGEYYIVKLSQSRYKSMKAQQAYWNDEGPAVPLTLTGMSKKTTTSIQSNFTKALDLGFGSSFSSYFGTRYLDTGARPTDNIRYPLILLAIFSGLCGLLPLLTANASRKKGLRNLERLGGGYGVTRAAAELDAPTTFRGPGDKLRVGENYVFGKRTGLLVPCEDVYWCYQRVQRTYFIVTGRTLQLYTADGNSYVGAALGRKGEDQIRSLMDVIAQRCPNARLGFSPENRNAWAAYVKELRKK